jgi:hypothetical protein
MGVVPGFSQHLSRTNILLSSTKIGIVAQRASISPPITVAVHGQFGSEIWVAIHRRQQVKCDHSLELSMEAGFTRPQYLNWRYMTHNVAQEYWCSIITSWLQRKTVQYRSGQSR